MKHTETKSLDHESIKQLDSLLQKRFHGAANIKGIRYQILYSVYLAMQLYKDGSSDWHLQLEGIEDADLRGINTDTCYIQIKASDRSWNWAMLKRPVSGFLEVLKKNPTGKFCLAVDFPLHGDIELLARINSLKGKDSDRIRKKFRNLCRDLGAASDEADQLSAGLNIRSRSERDICIASRQHIAEAFNLASEAIDIYLQVLVSRFLDWAQQRRTINRSDLDKVRIEVGEALSRESNFQAYGLGLIDRLHWADDCNTSDYFDGKRTRPGHIRAGLDVPRVNAGLKMLQFGRCEYVPPVPMDYSVSVCVTSSASLSLRR
ncbi:MAG: hypothetical protein ABFD46_02870 [Armatimonadota bacterium]